MEYRHKPTKIKLFSCFTHLFLEFNIPNLFLQLERLDNVWKIYKTTTVHAFYKPPEDIVCQAVVPASAQEIPVQVSLAPELKQR